MAQSLDIIINKEDEFVYIAFPILTFEKIENDKVKCIISGKYNNDSIEFTLITKVKYKIGITENGFASDAFEAKGIVLFLDKNNGRNLFKLFSNEYGIKSNSNDFRNIIEFTSFPLEEAAVNILNKPIKTKVFYDDQNERDEYFELFINIDLPSKKIEFSEKDIEYRDNIIKVFSSPL
jgi:hypothetical protein